MERVESEKAFWKHPRDCLWNKSKTALYICNVKYGLYVPPFVLKPSGASVEKGLRQGRIHSISIHGYPKIYSYPFGYPWFLDVSLQFSIQVRISTLISKQGYPCKDILQWMPVKHEYPRMDIHILWISLFNHQCIMDIRLDTHSFPRISTDMLWILDPGSEFGWGFFLVKLSKHSLTWTKFDHLDSFLSYYTPKTDPHVSLRQYLIN